MTSDLLTPATAELLAGWCGPVVEAGLPVVVLGPCAQAGAFMVADANGVSGQAWLSALRLDLSRAECRDRAARVLAERRTERPCPNGVRLAVMQGTVGAILALNTERGAELFYPRSGYRDQAKVGAEILAHAHPEALALRLCLEATRG